MTPLRHIHRRGPPTGALLAAAVLVGACSNEVGPSGATSSPAPVASSSPSTTNLPPLARLSRANVVAAGWQHACALDDAGAVFCWGDNGNDQLGYHGASTIEARRVEGLPSMVGLGATLFGAWSRTADGTVYRWGRGRDRPEPEPALDGLLALVVGEEGSCGRTREGLVCFGPAFADGGVRRRVHVPAARLRAFGGSDYHACGLTTAGQLVRLFIGMADPVAAAPTVGRAPAGAVEVVAGTFVICVRTDAGRVHCTQEDEFAERPALSDVVQIAVSQTSSESDYLLCALKADGTVWCSGPNGAGQLGDGTLRPSPTPVQVKGLVGVVQIALGIGHGVARLAGGEVWQWGGGRLEAAPVHVARTP